MRETGRIAERSSGHLPGDLLAGALAGFVATAPMTVAMELMRRRLPWWERYRLPPGQIVTSVAHKLGIRRHMDRSKHRTTTVAAHFAYGAAAGAVYAPLARAMPLPALLKGPAFGLIVWSISYLGLLPALEILPPATVHPPRRNALMIVAHIVWGATLGLIADLARPRR